MKPNVSIQLKFFTFNEYFTIEICKIIYSNRIPSSRTKQTILVFLIVEPSIETMLMERMSALPLSDGAGDVGIAEEYAVVANLFEGFFADAAVGED